MITYNNNFEKLKHKIYLSLNETSENGNFTTSFVSFQQISAEIYATTLDQNQTDQVQERELSFQQVGIANGAAN